MQLLTYRWKCGPIRDNEAFEYFYCSTYLERKSIYDNHVANSLRISGTVYKFHNQNLVFFEDNLKYRGDFRFVVYFNLRATMQQLKDWAIKVS